MEFERGINYYELDGMNVVHHSNYIRYMEEARIYLLDKIGLPYKKIEDNGIMIPVLEVNYKYKLPARFGDVIVIKVNIDEFDGIKLKIKYEIKNKETGKILGTGETKHCFTNSNMRPISLKKVNKEFCAIFEKSTKKSEN